MRGSVQDDMAAAADAFVAWWALAGVDSATDEAAVNWLRAVPAQIRRAGERLPVAPAQDDPSTLAEFHRWIVSDPAQPERRWPGSPILPSGPVNAPLMIVTDMPDTADVAAGALLVDRAGALFDAMLRAIGFQRPDIYLASLFLSRPPGGMVEAAELDHAATRMAAHVALAAPRRLLILGDRTVRALLPTNDDRIGMADADGLRVFNHKGGNVSAVATFHPRLLLTQPAAKAECWRVLQRLIEETPQ
ncbi:uracil-DNA glycosylase family protein [Sphingobium sp. AN558]|uniref:uracil-DNA glycosylase family protein n=1 Tax=Sphingobium sp. AN558 TaxID=3133442 RepID=UPI0030BCE6AE